MSARKMLDEPTNDMDTDMLAAIEDLLDSWAGTLLVVSHDRYFLERVTDQQYGLFGGRLRHLPGGVDEYLRLRAAEASGADSAAAPGARSVSSADAKTEPDAEAGVSANANAGAAAAASPAAPALSGAERRVAEKELAAAERRLERLQSEASAAREGLAELDQSDYQLIGVEMAKITALESEAAALEERWLELSEQLE